LVPITRGPIVGTLALPGRIQPKELVRVGSVQSGQVVEAKANVGERVVRGQVLARLDDFEQRMAIVTATGQLTSARVVTTRAERELERTIEAQGFRGSLPG